jgi:hypothetical protein
VDKQNVLAYITGYGESEIVARWEHVSIESTGAENGASHD